MRASRFVAQVRAQFLLSAVVLSAAAGCACGAGADRVFDVRDHGAKADGQTLDHRAIQAAIDACSGAGGGTVVVPPGQYLCGAVRLASGVTLRIEQGATILASNSKADYASGRHLFWAEDAHDVVIEGPGAIDGRATADYGGRWGAPEVPEFRVGILLLERCRNVAVRNLTIRNSDSWTLHFKRCDAVAVERVTIRNNYRRLNSDGIDPNMCRGVRISDCDITAGDDCIVLKATEAHPCQDVVVTGCRLESAASAIKLGTESHGDFRDIRFENCTVRNSFTGIGFYMKDGGTMERVVMRNIRIETCPAEGRTVTPIFMDIERRNPDSRVGRIRDVTIEDVEIRSGSGILIQGMPESRIENLALRRIRFAASGPDDYSKRSKPVGGRRTTSDERDTRFARHPAWAAIAYVRNLVLADVSFQYPAEVRARTDRSCAALWFVDGATVEGLVCSPPPPEGARPVLETVACTGLVAR